MRIDISMRHSVSYLGDSTGEGPHTRAPQPSAHDYPVAMTTTATLRNPALLRAALDPLGGRASAAWWVPGRIEILGKHTDYGGGQVLTCTTDLGMVMAMAPLAEPCIRVHSAGQTVTLDLTGADLSVSDDARAWAIYAQTVVRRLALVFPGQLRGTEISIAADLPAAAGLSSSSALLTGLLLAIATASDLTTDPRWPVDLAAWAACVENGSDYRDLRGERGVGTHGGAMDHTAIVGGRAGLLTHWFLGPVTDPAHKRLADVSLPAGTTLLIAVSGVVAEKTGAARERYNNVAHLARAALATWNQANGRNDLTLAEACAAGATPASFSDAQLARRVEHFRRESGVLVPGAAAALASGDTAAFARHVAQSQQLAEHLLGNQVPETIALAALATEHGALAASAFGAGFGGAVWALVPTADAERCATAWLSAYRQRFPQHQAAVHPIAPGPGLHRLSLT